MEASEKDFWALKRKGKGDSNFFYNFECDAMKMGCLTFPSCSQWRTDLRTKNKDHMEDGTG